MAININRNVDDTFYRYKMPRLVAKVEGKGNGIKTVIANMVDIAKSLNRPPTYPTKYFGCELGAQTQFDLKNDRYIVNGEHDAAKLQDLLDGFIKKFVLCAECENPETTLVVKGQKISLMCKACGHVTVVDPRQKLTTFVYKNPPDQVLTPENPSVTTGKRTKKDKKDKKEPGNVSGNHTATTPTEATNGDFGAEDHRDNNNSDEMDDEDWSVDPDAVQERQRELQGKMANITLNEDLEKPVEARMVLLEKFVNAKFAAGPLDPKVVVVEAERLDLKDEAVMVLCHVIFADPLTLLKDEQIKANRSLFLRFTYKNNRAQRHLLGGLEQLIVKAKKDLLPKVARILKTFYDEDILEEEQLLKWGEKSQKKYVTKEDNKEIRCKAEPFLKWLKEAEEESEDSDEGDDDDVEVVYENEPRAKMPAAIIPNGKPAAASINNSSGDGSKDDEFDIDDI